MNLLIKGATVLDRRSKHHGKKCDILVDGGFIVKIAASIPPSAGVRTISDKGMYVSIGFSELFAMSHDPGGEEHESINSLAGAAVAGGFTTVYTLPNTLPPICTKAQVDYVRNQGAKTGINVKPHAAVSAQLQGKALAEMHELHESGAMAFTDGLQPIASAGLLLKALQYVKSFDGCIIQLAHDNTIMPHGQMHEGVQSTVLGLPGIPQLAEELQIQRDLALLQYTDSKLHITGVSTAKGIQLIQKAKKDGLNVTCSVAIYHLLHTDAALAAYDSTYKVLPPLRDDKNRKALVKALSAGHIDAITTHHNPQNWDAKTKEFEYASFGMMGLETAFCSLLPLLQEGVPLEQIIHCLTSGARTALHSTIDSTSIVQNAPADLTVFTTSGKTTFASNTMRSKSHNTPYLGKTLDGRIVATVYNDNIFLC